MAARVGVRLFGDTADYVMFGGGSYCPVGDMGRDAIILVSTRRRSGY
jgi:hypothetical protein